MSGSSLRSFEYLEGLPGTTFNKLYQQPSTALAIFRRMLPHLAKTFVMAMLFQPCTASDLDSQIRPDHRMERDKALSLLERLHILKAMINPGKPRAYKLTSPFAESLRQALTGGGSHSSFGVPSTTLQKDRLEISQLDSYARKRWEGVLGYMVGSAEGVTVTSSDAEVSEGVKKLLKDSQLVKGNKKVTITQEGFAFVLQEVNAQVWTILINYLDAAEEMRMDPVDVLSFLFMLGSLELGQDYSKANLTQTQLSMLDDLGDFGLIYQSSRTSKRFYPTRLATTLTSDANALRTSANFSTTLGSSSQGPGYIVIETNYRVYAYTTSSLQIAILQLFCRLSTRYPNMVAGKITRESIRRAVAMGITSEQIITFLSTHAHPQMFKGSSQILPPTVVDQIKLWQIEGERMKATTGFLFKDFGSGGEYEECCRYAREVGVLTWQSDDRRMFFVTRHEQVAAYLKGRIKKAA